MTGGVGVEAGLTLVHCRHPTRVEPELSFVESTIRQLCRCRRLDPIRP